MILLARHILTRRSDGTILPAAPHLAVMDITVCRNSWGSQLHSFRTEQLIPEVSSNPIPLVFIRGPVVEAIETEVLPVPARIIAKIDDRIIAVRQGNMLATSFHPELTDDFSFHAYFCRMCTEKNANPQPFATSSV
jgi:5'-phosphate synthase pdxT subunit